MPQILDDELPQAPQKPESKSSPITKLLTIVIPVAMLLYYLPKIILDHFQEITYDLYEGEWLFAIIVPLSIFWGVEQLFRKVPWQYKIGALFYAFLLIIINLRLINANGWESLTLRNLTYFDLYGGSSGPRCLIALSVWLLTFIYGVSSKASLMGRMLWRTASIHLLYWLDYRLYEGLGINTLSYWAILDNYQLLGLMLFLTAFIQGVTTWKIIRTLPPQERLLTWIGIVLVPIFWWWPIGLYMTQIGDLPIPSRGIGYWNVWVTFLWYVELGIWLVMVGWLIAIWHYHNRRSTPS